MAYGDAFFSFIHNRKIGQFIYGGDNPGLFLTLEEVNSLSKEGHVADGTTGGLVIGKFPIGDKFKYVGEMEGYEYLVIRNQEIHRQSFSD